MRNGLYRVDHYGICAGFVVEGHQLAACAPVLLRNWSFWRRKAYWICE